MRGTRLAAVAAALLALTGCGPAQPTLGSKAPLSTGTPSAGQAPASQPGRSRPVADPLYPEYGNPALDVLSYDLRLRWRPDQRRLDGTATLAIRPVRAVTELSLDFASSYTVTATTVDGRASAARRGDNDLIVAVTAPAERVLTLVVTYHGTPHAVSMPSRRGDFAEGLGLHADAAGEAWTMQEPFGAFTWYPVNDHPSDEALYDVSVTVPDGWAAVAHGAFAGKTDSAADGEHTDTYRWHSAAPVASYLATLALGRYTMLRDTGPHGLPVTYWLRTGRDEAAEPALRSTPKLLAWLERRFGPYPFDSAGVVLVDSASAMETQQMITFGALISGDTETTARVLLHEFAHQWFGDAVTPTDWTGLWLNEGWAMYAEWLWSVDQGQSTHERWVRQARDTDAYSRAAAGPPGHPKPDRFGEGNVYLGPALMLHLIHEQVGDDAFFALARDWVQSQRNQPVDRAGFIAFVNQHTGRDFTKLINDWLDSPTTPGR